MCFFRAGGHLIRFANVYNFISIFYINRKARRFLKGESHNTTDFEKGISVKCIFLFFRAWKSKVWVPIVIHRV